LTALEGYTDVKYVDFIITVASPEKDEGMEGSDMGKAKSCPRRTLVMSYFIVFLKS
jgi:hypothetical protein